MIFAFAVSEGGSLTFLGPKQGTCASEKQEVVNY